MNRNMMMVFVDGDHASDVEQLLERCDAPGYSEIPSVLGKGESGRKRGSRAFPGSSTLFLVALDDHCTDLFTGELRKLQAAGGAHEGLKVYMTAMEELI